jgi:hypothetical protein
MTNIEGKILSLFFRFERLLTSAKYLYLVAHDEDIMSALEEVISVIRQHQDELDGSWCEEFHKEVSLLYRMECKGFRGSVSEICGFLEESQETQDSIIAATDYVDGKIFALVDLVGDILNRSKIASSMSFR